MRGGAGGRGHPRMPAPLPAAQSTLDALERIADEGHSAQELLEQAAARIDRVVPTDGYFMAATDPETTLAIGSGVVPELPPEKCQPHWDYEFLVQAVLKFADIARGPRRVVDIHDATGGQPRRSPRFKQYSEATGFDAEVRIAFSVGSAAWGLAQLNRRGRRFTADEKQWLDQAAASIGRGLRQAMLTEPAASPVQGRGPGVVLLDGGGRVVSVTDEALAWLDGLTAGVPRLSGDRRGVRGAERPPPGAAPAGCRRLPPAISRARLCDAGARRPRGR